MNAAHSAFWFGILSAVSLPLGAWVGLWTRPSERVTAGIMAFGAGALLAALSLELIHEALEKLHGVFWPIGLGCVLGGLAFYVLNHHLNKIGGFLRKTATLIKHVSQLKRQRVSRIIDQLSHVPLLNALPPEEINAIVNNVEERVFKKGTRVVAEGDPGFELYVVQQGRLEVTRAGKVVGDLGTGDVFGEMALLTDEIRKATVIATTDVRLLEIHNQDFDRLLKASPALAEAVQNLYRTRRHDLEELEKTVDPGQWAADAKDSVAEAAYQPTPADLREAVAHAKTAHGGAPMAIWLGIFLDGIPESAVIGANIVGGSKISMALIAGLFLANFPESMSSAVGMRKMGMSNLKISWLWGSLCLMTGAGAFIGNIAFQNAAPGAVAFFECLAGGAMLAMISETMLPEAYEHGGAIVGMATIMGFLSAVLVKTLG